MRKIIKIVAILSLTFAVATADQFAQSSDPQIELLQKSVEIIGKINSLPISFQTKSFTGGVAIEEVSAEGLANLKRQAALLSDLPVGTTVEIGVHTFNLEDTLFENGGPEAEKSLSEKRAELVRRELVKLGVKLTLTTKGYGATKPIASNDTTEGQLKNQRVEYLIAKLPNTGSDARKSESVNDSKINAIIAGRGWDKIVIGATRWDIEDALGEPEKFYEGNMILPDPSAQYFSRGIIVVYDAASERVKSIDFIGDSAYLDAGSYVGTFRVTAAQPDKNVRWGSSAAQIISAYGTPKHKLVETRKNAEVVTLTYDQITFTLNSDKLYYINVAADNNRFLAAMKKEAEEKPAREKYAEELANAAKPIAFNAEYTIVAGRGAGKITLGATRAQIEAALGQPDEFIDDADIFGTYEASYFSKGVKVEYDAKTKLATGILFFGDTAKTLAYKKFKLFPGATDKGIRWGMSPADVIKTYGEPVKVSMRYNPKLDKDYEYINYPNVSFGFNDNRLTFISNDPIWGK